MPNVSDGCIVHVGHSIDASLVRACHDAEYSRLLTAAGKYGSLPDFEAEKAEYEKVQAARIEIMKGIGLAAKVLLSMKALPDLIKADHSLEFRLLLCRVEKEPANGTQA